MEKPLTKFYLAILSLSFSVWIGSIILKNIEIGELMEFGTLQFRTALSPEMERLSYRLLVQYSIVTMASYSVVLISALLFLFTTRRSFKTEGWLLMSAVLLIIFIPVELYCFWLDWKIIGLNYWGEWPLEEFRKAFLQRLMAVSGLPFVAQLCYYTIPILVIFKPLRKQLPV